MLRSLNGQGCECALRLNIGITDSLPKLVAWRLIRPAVKAFPNLQLSCVEGHSQELLGSMAAGRLDVVLSDEAAPSSMPVKAFNHLLGESPVVVCATPVLSRKLSRGFPGRSRMHQCFCHRAAQPGGMKLTAGSTLSASARAWWLSSMTQP